MFTSTPPMSSRRPSRRVLFALAILSVAALAGLAMVALQQAREAGSAEFWLMAWTLAFVVGAPVLLLLLPVFGQLRAFARGHRIIPPPGVKNP